MRWSSLRVRLGLWYTLFTLGCLSAFGVFLSLYLGRALEASRAPTMVHRAERLQAFVASEQGAHPGQPLSGIVAAFLKASPESDEIVILSPDGHQLVFAGGGQPWLSSPPVCPALPCFREFHLAGHHIRSYTQRALLAGIPVRLTVIGSIDEHYGILRTVRTSYLLFVPFLLLASLCGGYLLTGRALLPVGRMTAVASQLSISDLHGRVPVPHSGDELQALAETWNSMLARLQASVEHNQQFTSDASHDLRTSVAVMLASAQLALRRRRTPEHYVETLRTLASECEHTLHMLEDLLSAARAGFEPQGLSLEPIELSQIIRDRCALFAAEASARNQTLTLEVSQPAWVSGDRLLLYRLIGTLVDNAVKYTQPGGSITVSLTLASPQRHLLQVRDTGPGIAEADLSRIFHRAFRAQSAAEAPPGKGLGLSIARWIAEAHHATLRVRSQKGAGSVFEIELNALVP